MNLLAVCRVMCDPNGLFCCGDPCQTIARGIVFRFADICTLFHNESQRRKVACSFEYASPCNCFSSSCTPALVSRSLCMCLHSVCISLQAALTHDTITWCVQLPLTGPVWCQHIVLCGRMLAVWLQQPWWESPRSPSTCQPTTALTPAY